MLIDFIDKGLKQGHVFLYSTLSAASNTRPEPLFATTFLIFVSVTVTKFFLRQIFSLCFGQLLHPLLPLVLAIKFNSLNP